MIKRFLATFVVTAFAFAIGIFTYSVSEVEAQADYSGHTVVLGMAEHFTDPASGEGERVEYFQNDLGNGQLDHDFVYNDPRNAWDTIPDVSLAVKEGNISYDDNLTNQVGWMYDSVYAWQNLQCSSLSVTSFAGSSRPGLVENFFAGGGLDLGLIEADLTQVGFRGVSAIFPPGTSTLGVAYTLFWVDENGEFTDIDNNGKFDVAFREIYYNDQYEWADNGVEGPQADGRRVFDFPTVAIHEAGHGLSAAHFGNIGVQNGVLVANPRAIMNAIYGGTYRDISGRDAGSHCSNWSQWPNN